MRLSKRLLLFLLVLSAGCVPYSYLARKPRTLTVSDAITKQPIAGAKVLIETWSLMIPNLRQGSLVDAIELTTSANGTVDVPRKKKLGFLMLAPDGGQAYEDKICIEKDGYLTFQDDPFNGGNESARGHIEKNRFELTPTTNDPGPHCR